MRQMTAEKAAEIIRRAYGTWKSQGNEGWMKTVEIFDRADLTIEEAAEGIRHLFRAGEGFNASDDPARNEHTELERACQIPLRRDDVIGLVRWR
ncbi:hypothetical protein GCM10010112_68000 [Actinoplanes lobatus]|uniref:Uncharacterized protein n=1 Tax=Actinoplanes lobatus TaxID=113568 RepID=A0A7W7HEQ3_9ACTN|nr:hypothetical protein [Actinoplanes lobatus]MBB4749120.1 hypothetical protein [Actinoplanes lobatus]GGN86425.1 hypothetical protein GCM10010112_68000 [Actinoplanes lobatus]GIE42782.1 hypothetical protein Alo02nite_56800 [Actinoplanes lobatus]